MHISNYRKILILSTLFLIGLLYYYEIHSTTQNKIILQQSSGGDIVTSKQFYRLENTGAISPAICISNPDIQFFMYHYIRAHDPHDNAFTTDLSVDPKDFRIHMQYIQGLRKEGKITTMNGSDFIKALEKQCFPSKNIWIFTSDDGWSDTYTDLYPIADEYQVPFFLGIITNRLDTPGFVTTDQVREISKNPYFSISSHSVTHSEQDKMNRAAEIKEMCESKNTLEKALGISIFTYIYPEGRMSKNSQDIAKKCGYQLAWSTGHGTKWNPSNPSKYDINRTRIHHTSTIDLFKNIVAKYK